MIDEAILREYDCAFCGALAGQYCTTALTGTRAEWSHSSRYEQAVKAERLSTDDPFAFNYPDKR